MRLEDYLSEFKAPAPLPGFGAAPSSVAPVRTAAVVPASTAASIVSALSDNRMWTLDTRWRPTATLFNASRCIRQTRFDGPLVDEGPYRPGACGHYVDGSRIGPTCNWALWLIPCAGSEAPEYAFQATRFLWAQTKLRQLLDNKPARLSPDYADAWTEWAWSVAQLLSVARWASNIRHPYYAAPASRYEEWKAAMDSSRPAPPSGMVAGYLSSLIALRLWDSPPEEPTRYSSGNVRLGGQEVPTGRSSFDPIRLTLPSFEGEVRAGPGEGAGMQATWRGQAGAPHPWQLIGRRLPQWTTNSLGRRVQVDGNYGHEWDDPKATFRTWCRATLGLGNWIGWPEGLPAVWRDGGTVRHGRVYPVWGTADATIRMLEANALDLLSVDLGAVVKAGVDQWVAEMARFPMSTVEQFRLAQAITDFDRAVQVSGRSGAVATQAILSERWQNVMSQLDAGMGLLGTIVGAVNAAGGVVVAIAGVLLRGVGELARSIGTAHGGIPCPPPPFIRAYSDSNPNSPCKAVPAPPAPPGGPSTPAIPPEPPPPPTTPPTAGGGGGVFALVGAYLAYRLFGG